MANPLVIPFDMVMRDVLRDRRSEVSFAERNQPVQAFLFDGPHEPFGVGICIRGALGRKHDADARLVESTAHVTAPLPVPIANEDLWSGRDPIIGHRQRPHDVLHEERLGMRRGSEDLDPS